MKGPFRGQTQPNAAALLIEDAIFQRNRHNISQSEPTPGRESAANSSETSVHLLVKAQKWLSLYAKRIKSALKIKVQLKKKKQLSRSSAMESESRSAPNIQRFRDNQPNRFCRRHTFWQNAHEAATQHQHRTRR